MAQLFPSWSDTALRCFLAVVFFGGVLGVPALLMAWVRTPMSDDLGRILQQPIQFDHRHHVRDDGIDCLYCHHDAQRSPAAGVPDTATCMGCHAQVWAESPKLEPLRRSWYSGQPIAWRRVHDLPDFVFFDHAVHVTRGVGCETCHGRVDLMAAVYKTRPLTMGWCLDCHRHPEPFLRPPEHATTMGYRPPEPQAIAGRKIRARFDIDPPTHCSGCHR